MMQSLRNNTKIIIWVVIVAFFWFMGISIVSDFFRWGGSDGATVDVVGRVNGEDISLREFGFRSNQLIESQRSDNPEKELTESDYRQARRDAWQQTLQEYLQLQQIQNKGIRLTDNELFEFMRYYPPQEAGQIDMFITDGKFDYQKYIQGMADPQLENLWVYLEQLSRPRFTTFKLSEYVGSMAKVSKPEVREKYIRDNERIKVAYALAALKDFSVAEIKIDSQTVVDYYNSHPDEFYEEEKAYYETIRGSKQQSDRDNQRALEEALEIKREIDAGGDFAELANLYTQDPSGRGTGGSLGWFGRGMMVSEFDSAAFAMKVGEISEPIKTSFGYHIIHKTNEREKDGAPEVEASHILIRPQVSQNTLDAIEIQVDDFRREVNAGADLDSAMAKYGFSAESVRSVTRDGSIPATGRDRELINWLFTDPDTVSAPYDLTNGYYLFRCDHVQPAGTAPLEEVYYKILRQLQEEQQGKEAMAKVQHVYDEVMAGTGFEAACKAEALEYKESAFFARTGRIPGLGQDPNFIGTAFTLSEANRYSKPILTSNGAAILEYLDRLPAKLDQFEQLQDTLMVQAQQPLQSAYWEKWFQGLIDNAKID
ncbi:MAG: peptidylprolyl isomerase, partial [bacterium]